MQEPIHVLTHEGIKISVNEHGKFCAEIDDADIQAASSLEIKNKIEQVLRNKRKAKKEVLAIKVVNEQLKSSVVTGIHARTGALTMTPKLECKRYGGNDNVYFDCARVRKLLEEKQIIKKRLEEIEEETGKFQIKADHGYGVINEAEYDRLMIQVKECAAKAEKLSRKDNNNGA